MERSTDLQEAMASMGIPVSAIREWIVPALDLERATAEGLVQEVLDAAGVPGWWLYGVEIRESPYILPGYLAAGDGRGNVLGIVRLEGVGGEGSFLPPA